MVRVRHLLTANIVIATAGANEVCSKMKEVSGWVLAEDSEEAGLAGAGAWAALARPVRVGSVSVPSVGKRCRTRSALPAMR